MKIVVLIENTAPEGSCLAAEHGLSFYVEHRGKAVLLDAGASGGFADNAAALGVDLGHVDVAVLSHGHYDHAGGLGRFFACNDHAKVYARPSAGGAYFSTSLGSPGSLGSAGMCGRASGSGLRRRRGCSSSLTGRGWYRRPSMAALCQPGDQSSAPGGGGRLCPG